jgi:NADH-ubiquinone oxidoreductase chain 6
MTSTIILNSLAFGILFSSAISITSNNPVISIIFLITAFVNAAGYLILLGINFIGISYIVIYVGAIAVLFLFIILMINIKLADILDSGNSYTKNLPVGLNIASLFLFIVISLLVQDKNITQFFPDLEGYNFFNSLEGSYGWISNTNTTDLNLTNFVQIEVLGHSLYIFAAVLLIILSLILLLSMLAIIVISKSNNKNI